MTYKTVACALDSPVDLDRVEKTASYYSDGKFFVEIYKNGTCVFPRVVPGEGVESGIKRLAEVGERPIDFTVREMDDHNYVVRFSDSVFVIVFRDEFHRFKGEIVQQATSTGGDEILGGKSTAPQEHLYIGLFARTRLLDDIQGPTLTRSVVPTDKR